VCILFHRNSSLHYAIVTCQILEADDDAADDDDDDDNDNGPDLKKQRTS
jgi:hypothetical protein